MDQNISAKETELWNWWNPAVAPLVKAIYNKDTQLGTALIEAFRENLARSGLDPDLQQAAAFKLCYVSNQFLRITGIKSRPEALSDTIAGLNERGPGPVSEAIRAQLLIQARTIAESIGEGVLGETEFHDLLASSAAVARPPEFWHYVASWGFLHDRVELVKLALGELTINSDGYQSDLVWQRTNLIHLLMEDRAEERDVVELIKRINNTVQWDSIMRLVWPAVEQAGLHRSEKVQSALRHKMQQFDAHPDEAPRRDLPTKGIAKHTGSGKPRTTPPTDNSQCCP